VRIVTGVETTYDRAAETAVLAACLLSPTARAEAKRHITGSDFQQPAHEVIWDAMTRLDRHKRMVDPVSVLALVQTNHRAAQVMVDVAACQAIPDNVAQHAEIVRGWAIKRRLAAAATGVLAHALQPDTSPSGYAAQVATTFAGIRDSGVVDDVTSKTMAEVLADPDDEPDWLVPGLLERRDRLVLTGSEGLGKSFLMRQIAICAAAGVDPLDPSLRFDPIKTAIFDCENTENQIRRATRGIVSFAAHYGRRDVADRVFLRCSSRMDITRDKDLAQIHHELDALLPDLVVIGPLYRLIPRAIQTDDDAAPVLAALDTIRAPAGRPLCSGGPSSGTGYVTSARTGAGTASSSRGVGTGPNGTSRGRCGVRMTGSGGCRMRVRLRLATGRHREDPQNTRF
jgi:hypothetical protein